MVSHEVAKNASIIVSVIVADWLKRVLMQWSIYFNKTIYQEKKNSRRMKGIVFNPTMKQSSSCLHDKRKQLPYSMRTLYARHFP